MNFVLTAKRTGHDENQMIEALRAEFGQTCPTQKTWDRIRKLVSGVPDPTLGDARRMFRMMRVGETAVYGEPAYTEPQTNLDAASEELWAAVADQIRR